VFKNRAAVQRCMWHYADLRIMPTSAREVLPAAEPGVARSA